MRPAESDGTFFTFMALIVAALFIIAAAVFGVDSNGFSCPAGSQTVWEDGDDAGEIEGCILPGGRWMDDPD